MMAPLLAFALLAAGGAAEAEEASPHAAANSFFDENSAAMSDQIVEVEGHFIILVPAGYVYRLLPDKPASLMAVFDVKGKKTPFFSAYVARGAALSVIEDWKDGCLAKAKGTAFSKTQNLGGELYCLTSTNTSQNGATSKTGLFLVEKSGKTVVLSYTAFADGFNEAEFWKIADSIADGAKTTDGGISDTGDSASNPISSHGALTENDQLVQVLGEVNVLIPAGFTYARAPGGKVALVASDESNGDGAPALAVYVKSGGAVPAIEEIKAKIQERYANAAFSETQQLGEGRYWFGSEGVAVDGAPTKSISLVFERNGQAFVLIYTSGKEQFDEAEFMKISDSFGL